MSLRLLHSKCYAHLDFPINMKIIIVLLSCISSSAIAQQADWIRKPKEQWPQIAMINEVWYKNGERYIHPSFEYAATGFLIDTGKDTLAVTVKHVLWIAKAKSMNSVDLKNNLQRWIMHPKGNVTDSVVIDKLLNKDSTEILEGPNSTITQRDWLVFTTQYVSSKVQPLKPRFTSVKVGERVWYFGCPYNDKSCVTGESEVLEVEGNRIIFAMPKDAQVGGASGSPIVDKDGFLVGILGGSSVNKKNGAGALYGISTHYLQKVLDNKKPLNVPLIPINEVLKSEINKNGIDAGLKRFKKLKRDSANLFKYDFSTEKLNALGEDLLKEKKTDWAISIYKLSLSEYKLTSTYTKLGKAYLTNGQKEKAKEAYEKAIELWPENEEALEALKVLN